MTASFQGRVPLPTPSAIPQATDTATDNKPAAAGRNLTRTKPVKGRQDAQLSSSVSTVATLSLIRRILVADRPQNSNVRGTPTPIEDVLPPLTSSNEVDVQLYAIIAIILKDFVNTWYTKITPDRGFGEEIVQTIAHLSRALEERLRHVDVVELIFNDLAMLLEQHVKAYRSAIFQSQHHSYARDARQIYHCSNNHPALGPVPYATSPAKIEEQERNERAYRQLLVSGMLAVLLPAQDVQNAPLRILVGDILADLVLGQALAGKMCENWFIHTSVSRIVDLVGGDPKSMSPIIHREEVQSQLETFGLLASKNQHQTVSKPGRRRAGMAARFWGLLQVLYLIFISTRFVVYGLFRARGGLGRSKTSQEKNNIIDISGTSPQSHAQLEPHQPVLTLGIFRTCSTVVRFADRMPWLQSLFAFLQQTLVFGVGRLASADSVLDRFLYDTIRTNLLSSSLIPQILLSLRATLFPNNTLGPPAPPAPSTKEEIATIRRNAAKSILSLIPPIIAHTYYHTTDHEQIVEQIAVDVLDCFDDSYMNKHLVYGVLEVICVRLVPELEVKTVSELLAERGIEW